MALFKRTYLCLNRKGKPLNPSSRSTYHILEYLVLTWLQSKFVMLSKTLSLKVEFQYICSVTANPDLLFGLFSVICYLRPNVINQLLYCCIYISNYPFHCHYCVSQHVLTTQSISHQSQMYTCVTIVYVAIFYVFVTFRIVVYQNAWSLPSVRQKCVFCRGGAFIFLICIFLLAE